MKKKRSLDGSPNCDGENCKNFYAATTPHMISVDRILPGKKIAEVVKLNMCDLCSLKTQTYIRELQKEIIEIREKRLK